MVLRLEDQSLYIWTVASGFVRFQNFLEEIQGQFCALFLVVSKIWLVNDIVEPNGEFNNTHFLLAECISFLGEGWSSPLLQQSEDMLVAVVKPPVLGILPENAFPPLVCLFFGYSKAICKLLEVSLVLAILLN